LSALESGSGLAIHHEIDKTAGKMSTLFLLFEIKIFVKETTTKEVFKKGLHR
jgi:hypothetical protein